MNNEIKIQQSKGNNKVEISNNFTQYFEQLAKKHADDAKESELLAKDWANKLGSTVDDTEYSSKHYALKSKEEHDGAVTDIATAKTELEQSIATGLEDYNTNAQAKSDSLQTQFDTSISDIKKQETTSVNAVKTTQTTAETSITALKTSAKLTITNGIADITANKEQSMSAIDENRETSLAEIESAKSGAVSSLNETKDNAVTTIKQTGDEEYNKIISTGIDAKANSDLSNLTEAGEKHFLNKSQITNCLLEVPQRIKLELNDGVLTLKAGSQVIIPDGFEADGTTPKFDYVITEQDMQYHNISQFDKVFLVITKDLTNFVGYQEEYVSSGSTEQTTTGTHYNTTTNIVTSKLTSGVTYEVSLPICTLSTDSNGDTTSFNIFNGMGYIGSTVWVDKGVKGLIPNGRNSDGSLINEETTTNRLSLKTYTTETINSLDIWIYRNSAENLIQIIPSIETNSTPPAGFYGVNKEKNIIISHLNEQEHCFNAGIGSISNGKITSFAPKFPFRALDYSDKSMITGWSFQSNKYKNLTLGASGTHYIAPADGWFVINKRSTGAQQYVNFGKIGSIPTVGSFIAYASGVECWSFQSVLKGEEVKVYYTCGGKLEWFRFIYAVGSNPST